MGGMIKPDILLKIHYAFPPEEEEPSTKPDIIEIKTNAKPEMVSELIAEYLRTKVGSGGQDGPAEARDSYDISLGIELTEDEWGCEDNCGAINLRLGLLMATLRALKEGTVTIVPLGGANERREEQP